MALSILDGNQSATTLSTILSSGQHITAHTVISLGTQAITDIVNATSANLTNTQLRASAVTVGGTVTVGNSLTISSLPAISGTVTANLGNVAGTPLDTPPSHAVRIAWANEDTLRGAGVDNGGEPLPIQIYLGNSSADNVTTANPLPISALPAGTNRIGVVTIGGGTVTIGAGTAQIGTVTVGNISSLPDAGGNAVVRNFMFGYDYENETPIAIASDGTALNISGIVSINSGSALPAGTNQIGSVTANPSISSAAITSGSFTSLTSATLVPANTARKMATVYNLGAGQLFINAGASATTLGGGFMVALNSGDFYECNYTTTTLSAIFATAGTASWMSH
jgi:hypothetical protein